MRGAIRPGPTITAIVLGAVLVLAVTASAADQGTRRHAFRITKLSGSIVRLGSWTSGYRSLLYGVRLRAAICDPNPAKGGTYPDFRITHYEVNRARHDWWPRRIVEVRPAWLVPLGETWKGNCGPLLLEDPIPPNEYAPEELGGWGADSDCFGVGLKVTAPGKAAGRRIVVKCGPRF